MGHQTLKENVLYFTRLFHFNAKMLRKMFPTYGFSHAVSGIRIQLLSVHVKGLLRKK